MTDSTPPLNPISSCIVPFYSYDAVTANRHQGKEMGTRQRQIAEAMHELRRIERNGNISLGGSNALVFVIEGDLVLNAFAAPAVRRRPARQYAAAINESGERKMSGKTRYVCQTYRRQMQGKRSVLVRDTAVECKSGAEAEARARRMYPGRCAGADAYAIDVDTDLGEYGDPAFLCRLGEVPQIDC